MTTDEVEELKAIFEEPADVYYYKDKHLIDRLLGKTNASILLSSLKQMPEKVLLQKEWFKKEIMSKCQNAALQRAQLAHYWPADTTRFVITTAAWGTAPAKYYKDSWYQTSRSGFNLVLQVNFCEEHNQKYYSLLKPVESPVGIFNTTAHPVAKKFKTLGWLRLDIDFETNEVLIEEIQNDWLRNLKWTAAFVAGGTTDDLQKRRLEDRGIRASLYDFYLYQQYLSKYAKQWDEMLLTVGLQFITNELQPAALWMHTFESGLLFKDLYRSKPPKSLYSALPPKMGFVKVDETPAFIAKESYLKRYVRKAAREHIGWYKYAGMSS
ncbi:hypothetical protein GC194_00055 [bacterium]|nr:hypothetical protein [bacterium]